MVVGSLVDDINLTLSTGHLTPTVSVIVAIVVLLVLFRLLFRLGS